MNVNSGSVSRRLFLVALGLLLVSACGQSDAPEQAFQRHIELAVVTDLVGLGPKPNINSSVTVLTMQQVGERALLVFGDAVQPKLVVGWAGNMFSKKWRVQRRMTYLLRDGLPVHQSISLNPTDQIDGARWPDVNWPPADLAGVWNQFLDRAELKNKDQMRILSGTATYRWPDPILNSDGSMQFVRRLDQTSLSR